jgi:hypothetical protein
MYLGGLSRGLCRSLCRRSTISRGRLYRGSSVGSSVGSGVDGISGSTIFWGYVHGGTRGLFRVSAKPTGKYMLCISYYLAHYKRGFVPFSGRVGESGRGESGRGESGR